MAASPASNLLECCRNSRRFGPERLADIRFIFPWRFFADYFSPTRTTKHKNVRDKNCPANFSPGNSCPAKSTEFYALVIRALTGCRIEEQLLVLSAATIVEVKHGDDRVGDVVVRTFANALAAEPVIFDELQHGGLIR